MLINEPKLCYVNFKPKIKSELFCYFTKIEFYNQVEKGNVVVIIAC